MIQSKEAIDKRLPLDAIPTNSLMDAPRSFCACVPANELSGPLGQQFARLPSASLGTLSLGSAKLKQIAVCREWRPQMASYRASRTLIRLV
jgi:hypothetical protein